MVSGNGLDEHIHDRFAGWVGFQIPRHLCCEKKSVVLVVLNPGCILDNLDGIVRDQ